MHIPAPLPLTDAERAAFTSDASLPGGIALQEVDLTGMLLGWGLPGLGHWVGQEGVPLQVGGRTYPRGVGTHARSEFTIFLSGQATRFAALAGIDENNRRHGAPRGSGSCAFEAWGDGRLLAATPVLRGGDPAVEFAVDLTGVHRFTLVVTDGGDGSHWDHADWLGAHLYCAHPEHLRPETMEVAAVVVMAPSPVRVAPPAPVLLGPPVVGTTPGRPFLHRLGLAGGAGARLRAEGLPEGLELDPASGIIRGRVASAGTHRVRLTAEGPGGSDQAVLTIEARPRALARTPPMGWNSWNCWGTAVDAAKIRAACDALVESGLADLGYHYVNIDDAWEGERDAAGVLQPNARFGDLRVLADHVHSRGLKLGLYSSPGPKTCGGYVGSYQHEPIDARTWAAWGIDFLKHDWCSYTLVAGPNPDLAARQLPYRVMRAALDAVDRDIVYSLCQYGDGEVWRWGAEIGGNLWRTSGDIVDTWGSVLAQANRGAEIAAHAQPGHWNDPDMLVVGWVGWGPHLHATRLLPNEQVAHLSLWAMMAAPLLIGCDLTRLDELTLDLLGNPEVIAIDQDPLGQAATVVDRQRSARSLFVDDLEVWSRPLADGRHAVLLFNRGTATATVQVEWARLGRRGSLPVRDLWARQDLGHHSDGFSASVPPHGVRLVAVG